jgi:hypothetical protein
LLLALQFTKAYERYTSKFKIETTFNGAISESVPHSKGRLIKRLAEMEGKKLWS